VERHTFHAAGSKAFDELLQKRRDAESQLALLDQKIKFVLLSTCGTRIELQDVENYDGSLGVTESFVADVHPAVGQLRWHVALSGVDDPGNVAGVRWGTGALVTKSLFLTAGHCFDNSGSRWQLPTRGGAPLSPQEIATSMSVDFNFEVVAGTEADIRPPDIFPVVALREYRIDNVDFAIVELGKNPQGNLPGDVRHPLKVAHQDVMEPKTPLCIIQHPDQQPKKVGSGHLLKNVAGLLRYNDIDTDDGSSGAPVFAPEATEIIAVHVLGGCTANGGANRGVPSGVIRQVSNLIP
jgi:hypothetical protein